MAIEVSPTLRVAIESLIQTETVEEAYVLLEEYPDLLSDQADLLLSSVIHAARQQGHENTAIALDKRRDFLREVRERQESSQNERKH